MIAPDKSFVRRLRDRVRATAEFKIARNRIRRRWYQRPVPFIAHILRCLVPLVVLMVGSASGGPATLYHLLVLWTLMVTLFRAQVVIAALSQPAGLMVYYLLPLSNATVFRHQARLILRGSIWIGLDWLALGIVHAWHSGGVVAWLAAPVLALAQWGTSLAVALVLVRWNPRLPYGAAANILWFFAVVGLQMAAKTTLLVSLVIPIRDGLDHFTPGGWGAWAGSAAASGGIAGWLVLIGFTLGAGALIRWSEKGFRARFRLEPLFGYDESTPGNASWTRAEPTEPASSGSSPRVAETPQPPAEPPAPVDLSALRTALRAQLDQPAGLVFFRRGLIERLIARRLTERQRVIVDFLQPQGRGWTRSWLMALGGVAFAHLLIVAGCTGVVPPILAMGGVLFLAVPLVGGRWLGFFPINAYQSATSAHSLVPLGFWEVAATRLIIAGLRCVIALPLIYLLVAFGFTASALPWPEALAWTLRGFVALLVIQPVWIFLSFSAHSNDASSRWWFTTAIIVVMIVGLLVLTTAFIAIAAEPSVFAQILGAALLLVYSYGALWLYGIAYNNGIFDLIRKPAVQH